jgi:Tfp pilus assembly protein PilF
VAVELQALHGSGALPRLPEALQPEVPTWAEAPSSVTIPFPQGRRSVRRYLALLLGGLLLAAALPWLGERVSFRRPASVTEVHELYEQGLTELRRYDKKGHLDTAIADFRQILAREPDHAPALAALARACWLKSRNESKDRMWLTQALPLAERAVALDGYLASARVSLGLVYISLGRLDDAERELRRAVQLEPANADAQFGLAKLWEARTRLAEAEAAFRRAIALRPDRQFYDALGALYQRSGRLPAAIAAFQESIRLAPDGFLGYRNLGTAYYLQGDLTRAATQFQKALEIEPQSSLYSNLGTLYFAQGLYPQSAEAFERALELPGGANDYLLWGNLGDACRWLPEGGARAREAYSRALQLLAERPAPGDATLGSRRAVYLAKRGDCPPALAASSEMEGRAALDAASRFRLAISREVCGQRAAALATLEAALRAGFPPAEVGRDPELLQLRGDVRYHRMLVRLPAASSPP